MTSIEGITLAQAAGLIAVCGGILVVLHLLRVRPRPIAVVTTLFWSQAAQQSRARTLLERFRHLATFLLALLVCALIVLAWTRPRWSSDAAAQLHRVIVVDAGLSMGAVDAAGQSPFSSRPVHGRSSWSIARRRHRRPLLPPALSGGWCMGSTKPAVLVFPSTDGVVGGYGAGGDDRCSVPGALPAGGIRAGGDCRHQRPSSRHLAQRCPNCWPWARRASM